MIRLTLKYLDLKEKRFNKEEEKAIYEIINLAKKGSDALKAVESAGDMLPEKKVIGMFDHNGSNRVFNDTISLCQIPYAKQILKIEELERSLEFYRMRCNVIEKEHRSFKEPERTIICNILVNGQAKP